VVLFPVPTREGPVWITSPGALSFIGVSIEAEENVVLCTTTKRPKRPLNLGWLLLPREEWPSAAEIREKLLVHNVPEHMLDSLALVSDKLFGHVVNSNLEVRTSVAINPATGAAEDGALFTYEALPRATVLAWDVTCRDPRHFGRVQKANPHSAVTKAHPLLEALGIGGMASRGMGRLRVLCSKEATR
jgi:CRISPR-associated protein Cmr4